KVKGYFSLTPHPSPITLHPSVVPFSRSLFFLFFHSLATKHQLSFPRSSLCLVSNSAARRLGCRQQPSLWSALRLHRCAGIQRRCRSTCASPGSEYHPV